MQPPTASPHRPHLGDRLREARRGLFVGRGAELDLVRRALTATRPECAVVYVHGPGGVGKTALLQRYQLLATEAGRPVVWLDGRDVQPNARGVAFVLAQALGLVGEVDPLAALRALDRPVIFIDAYEAIEPLDHWLRTRLLPQLGAECLVVIAGRNAPSDAWRTDPGWQAVTRIVPLRNLTPEESRALLLSRGVAASQVAAILRFTHGHPLALCLTAEVARRGAAAPADLASAGADVVDPLLSRFVADAPTDAHRRALEASAIAWRTTQPLLAAALEVDESAALPLFEWLRGLPFVEHGNQGIFPHDLVRDVIFEDLRERHPDLLRGLVRRISAAEASRFLGRRGYEQHQALWALLFVTRHHPSMRPFYDWTGLGHHYAEPARPEDGGSMIAMVERHEGVESARLAADWFARQPEGFSMLRGVAGDAEGFIAHITFDDQDRDAAVDPAVAALSAYVRRHGPLRPGERVGVSRFWMDGDQYQTTTAFNMGATLATVWWMTEPRLAWSFVVLRDLGFWLPMFRYVNFEAAEGAEFVVGGHRYGAVGHDWRAEPRMAWWRLLGERREASLVSPTEPRPRRPAPLLVLSEPAFKEAVRAALRDYTRPQALAANPLLRSRLVVDRAGAARPPVPALQGMLRAAVESLDAHPRDRKLFRALWHTYIEPERTQEQAAEALGLPFSTYRRHLTAGIRHVADWLWRHEIGGALPG